MTPGCKSPRVDFYVLPATRKPLRFACELSEKVWKKGHQVHLHADSEQQADELNGLLWTFRDVGFVPHQICPLDDAPECAITIGWGEHRPRHRQVLLNLAQTVPPLVEDFERVAELVPDSEAERKQARQHYRCYQDMGFELHKREIGDGHR